MWPEHRMPFSVGLRRSADLMIAVVAGAAMALISYAAMSRPPPHSISRYFMEHSYSEDGGTNLVNVIFGDFRAFAPLGELNVLCFVALTIFYLIRRFRPALESVPAPLTNQTKAHWH